MFLASSTPCCLKLLPVEQADELVSLFTPAISAAPVRLLRCVGFRLVHLCDRADVLSGLIAYWRQSVRIKSIEQAKAFITADMSPAITSHRQ